METVYRIAEEALHNIEKHAGANQMNIRVKLDQADPANHVLKLAIEDDGKGFDPIARSPGHFGLLGMREQADILGAKFEVSGSADKGTCIQLEVPI